VFDEMPARSLILNFWNFSVWVINILAQVSKYIFVTKNGSVLQKFIFQDWVWSLF
jgi:hypothetical protein